MRDGHRGMFLEHQLGNRLADNIAAPDHDTVCTDQWNLVSLKHFDNTRGCAGNQTIAAEPQQADVDWMEAVNIFFRADGLDHAKFVDMLGQGQLAEDAMHRGVVIELIDEF